VYAVDALTVPDGSALDVPFPLHGCTSLFGDAGGAADGATTPVAGTAAAGTTVAGLTVAGPTVLVIAGTTGDVVVGAAAAAGPVVGAANVDTMGDEQGTSTSTSVMACVARAAVLLEDREGSVVGSVAVAGHTVV